MDRVHQPEQGRHAIHVQARNVFHGILDRLLSPAVAKPLTSGLGQGSRNSLSRRVDEDSASAWLDSIRWDTMSHFEFDEGMDNLLTNEFSEI